MKRITALLLGIAFLALASLQSAQAYLLLPVFTLGDICKEAKNIAVVRIDSVDKENKAIVFKHAADLKGKWPAERMVHKFGKDFRTQPHELQPVDEAVVGQDAVLFERDGNSILLVGRSWYHVYKKDKEWLPGWVSSEFLHAYWGTPKDLIPAVKDVVAGKEAIVECVVSREKDANGRPQVRRLKAALNRNGFDPKRDSAD